MTVKTSNPSNAVPARNLLNSVYKLLRCLTTRVKEYEVSGGGKLAHDPCAASVQPGTIVGTYPDVDLAKTRLLVPTSLPRPPGLGPSCPTAGGRHSHSTERVARPSTLFPSFSCRPERLGPVVLVRRPPAGGLRGARDGDRDCRKDAAPAGPGTRRPAVWWFSMIARIVRPTATAVPLSVWTGRGEPLRLGPEAGAQAPCLVIGRVRARRQLAVPALAGQPCLAVVLLGRRGAEVADGHVHYSVGDLQLLQDLLLDREQALVLLARGRRARRTRTSPPCRTGGRGRSRAYPCRPPPPRA